MAIECGDFIIWSEKGKPKVMPPLPSSSKDTIAILTGFMFEGEAMGVFLVFENGIDLWTMYL